MLRNKENRRAGLPHGPCAMWKNSTTHLFIRRLKDSRLFLRGRFIPFNIWVGCASTSEVSYCTPPGCLCIGIICLFSQTCMNQCGEEQSAHGSPRQVLPGRGASFWAGACEHQAFVHTLPPQTAKLQVLGECFSLPKRFSLC